LGIIFKKKIRQPRQKRLPKVLSHNNINRLLSQVNVLSYRTCFQLMYVCGLRTSESISLQISQIDSQANTLTIIGKGDKERIVPIPEAMLEQLRQVWKSHRHERYLFLNKSATNHVAPNLLYKCFNDALRKANLNSSLTPHSLRHCYATRLVEQGVDISIVQRLMGHSSIKSTVIYTHLTAHTRTQVKEVLNELMN